MKLFPDWRPWAVRFLLLLLLAAILVALLVCVVPDNLRHHVVWVAFSPDGETLGAAVSSYRAVQLHDPDPKSVYRDLQLAFYVWNLHSSSASSAVERKDVPRSRGWFRPMRLASGPSIVFSPDGWSFATANMSGEVALWDLKSKERLYTFHADDELLCAVAFSPDGRDLIAGGMNGVHMWHLADPAHEFLWMKDEVNVYSLAISPDGKYLLSSDGDGIVEFWSLAAKKHLTRVRGSEIASKSSPVAFSCDGRLFAARTLVWEGNHGHPQLTLWDTATQKEVRSFGTMEFPFSECFVSDASALLSDDGEGGLLWNDLQTGKQREIEGVHDVRCMAISPDGQKLATGDRDGNVVLRDIHTMQELARFHLPASAPPYWLIPLGALILWAFLWDRMTGSRPRDSIARGQDIELNGSGR